MKTKDRDLIEQAKDAALKVLLHNIHGPYRGLPRTAGWGYPEPYTRDIMIASLGMLVSGNKKLIDSLTSGYIVGLTVVELSTFVKAVVTFHALKTGPSLCPQFTEKSR